MSTNINGDVATPLYRDPSRPIEERIADLLGRMTLDEKLAQLVAGAPSDSRLHIPALKWADSLHCVRPYQREDLHSTVFPQAIALASSWNPDMVERVAGAIALESRTLGFQMAYSPVLDVAVDPRWGRTEETFGEDPYLISRLGVAYIQGMQGHGVERLDSRHVIATAKHFCGYGEGARGINGAAADISERKMLEIHYPPFEAAVREAKVEAVMPAHTSLNGIPCHCNGDLLNRLLRKEWGFDGLIVSDNRDVIRLHNMHCVAASPSEAAAMAINAGVDQDLVLQKNEPRPFSEWLKQAIADGLVNIETLNVAVARVLRAKFRLGLFEGDNGPANADACDCPAHRQLALEAARQCIVLLKNENDLLPLDPSRICTIAVIGPNADSEALGWYTGGHGHVVSALKGIREHLGDKVEVIHAKGCDILAPSTAGFAEAAEAAQMADIALIVVGDSLVTCKEGVDRDDLSLPGVQQQLVENVIAQGKPTIVLLLNGRPPAISWIAEHAQAILEGWYLGVEGGRAVAEVLFGITNPSGRLPISFPRCVGQLPVVYWERPSFTGSGKGQYLNAEKNALFPFGYGLSYTKFTYGEPRLRPNPITPGQTAVVEVDVRNIGSREGVETVQLYIRDEVSSVTQPLKILRGFQRLALIPGERKTAQFRVGPAQLGLFNREFRFVVEPGTFQIMVGPDSVNLRSARLEVVNR